MSTTTLPTTAYERSGESQWAVETHGLTKRFKDNVAVDGVELSSPEGAPSAISAPTGPARPPSSGSSSV